MLFDWTRSLRKKRRTFEICKSWIELFLNVEAIYFPRQTKKVHHIKFERDRNYVMLLDAHRV